MEDLDKRALKYSWGAGIIQTGHFDAAHMKGRYHRWLAWANVILTTLVGGSIFVKYGENWPVFTGVFAVLAAVVGGVNSISKFSEEAEKHKEAGAKYGRIRRRADMLRLKIAAADVERPEALKNLEFIGESMSDLAEASLSLPDSIFLPARDKFDSQHLRDPDKR